MLTDIGKLFARTLDQIRSEVYELFRQLCEELKALPQYEMFKEKLEEVINI